MAIYIVDIKNAACKLIWMDGESLDSSWTQYVHGSMVDIRVKSKDFMTKKELFLEIL